MPSVDELTPLFRAISHKNWTSVEDEAKSVAMRLDEKGQHTAARTLRGALTATNGTSHRFNQPKTVISTLTPPNSLQRIDCEKSLVDVCLRPKVNADLEQLVREWQNRIPLERKGLAPRRKLLFYGPPGCGKSLCAGAIGAALGFPVYVVRFDGIIGSMLGQTAVNLRSIFEYCEKQPSVLLIDEIDALGRQRGQRLDVGELDRIVISLMQELEHDQKAGIVIATCNVPKDLDLALWRRFDSHLEFPLPTKTELARYVKGKALALGIPLSQSLKQSVSARISYADAERLLEAEARRLVLNEL
jgi:SpoVK/Ycf46/Vps4 family AAA+-type ATPase